MLALSLLLPIVAAEQQAPRILFEDHFDRAAAGIVKNGEFVEGQSGQALSLSRGGTVSYAAKGKIRVKRGTVELWIKLRFDPQEVGVNQPLFRLNVDKANQLCFYYNSHERGLVFYAADSDSQVGGAHTKGYPFILSSGALPWHRGEWHHVAVAWEDWAERIYLDGRLAASAGFPGHPQVDPSSICRATIRSSITD